MGGRQCGVRENEAGTRVRAGVLRTVRAVARCVLEAREARPAGAVRARHSRGGDDAGRDASGHCGHQTPE